MSRKKNAIIVDIVPKDLEKQEICDDRMVELENLVNTYGSIVVVRTIQRRAVPDYRTYIGKGKLEEVIAFAQEHDVDLIIFGNILKPRQIFTINFEFEKRGYQFRAWDRVDLILKIFQLHATTPESKLQIQLAAIKHMGPRVYGMGMELDRQGSGSFGGGSGMRGIGETNTEIMHRHLATQEKEIRKKLMHYSQVRTTNRHARKRNNHITVGLVGYTNAGKSTLMNALTEKSVLVADKLFATLSTTVGKMRGDASMYLDEDGAFRHPAHVLIHDTIGFIRDLPPELIDAFRSTLEESIQSDILLHVIDASHPNHAEHIRITDDILTSIGAHTHMIYVFNQIDKISTSQRRKLRTAWKKLQPLFVSSLTGEGLDELKCRLRETQADGIRNGGR